MREYASKSLRFFKSPLVAVPTILFLAALGLSLHINPLVRPGTAAQYWEKACGIELGAYRSPGLSQHSWPLVAPSDAQSAPAHAAALSRLCALPFHFRAKRWHRISRRRLDLHPAGILDSTKCRRCRHLVARPATSVMDFPSARRSDGVELQVFCRTRSCAPLWR